MMNGTRQPQSIIASLLSQPFSTAAVRVPAISARPTLNCCTLPMRPRLPGGEYSTRNAAAPPHSPPVEKPCTSRHSSSSIGAQMPMLP